MHREGQILRIWKRIFCETSWKFVKTRSGFAPAPGARPSTHVGWSRPAPLPAQAYRLPGPGVNLEVPVGVGVVVEVELGGDRLDERPEPLAEGRGGLEDTEFLEVARLA